MPNPSMRNANPSLTSRLGPVTSAIFSSMLMTGCAVGTGGCNDAKFTSQRSQTLTAAAESSFRIENSVGDIKVVSDPGATNVTMELTFIGKGSTQQKADEALSEITLNINDPEGDTGVTATARHPSHSGWSGKQWQVRWVVTAPPSVRIDINDDVGDITVVGFDRGVKVSTDVGDVRISGVMGGVTVRTDVGNAVINAQGPADISTDVGNVRIELLADSQPVKVSTDVGNVHIVVPPSWAGTVKGSADVGSVNSAVAGLTVNPDRSGGGRISGTIGPAPGTATAELKSDVGSITIEQREVARATN